MKHPKLIAAITAITASFMMTGSAFAQTFNQLINPPNSTISWTVFAHSKVSVSLENLSKQLVSATLTNRSYVDPTSETYVMLPQEIKDVSFFEPAFISGCYWSFELMCTQTGVHIIARTTK